MEVDHFPLLTAVVVSYAMLFGGNSLFVEELCFSMV